MSDAEDKPLSDEERRRRWNRAVMAGSVAPRAAPWAMPKAGWRQLRGMSRKAVVGMGLVCLFAAVFVGAIFTGHGRVAAYFVLAAFGVYVVGCALYLGLRHVASSRRQR